jgi:hypothetical protein
MPRIKIRDLPKDVKLPEQEAQKIRGGTFPSSSGILGHSELRLRRVPRGSPLEGDDFYGQDKN